MNAISALQTKEANLKKKIERLRKSEDDNKEEALARAQFGLAEVQDAIKAHPEKGNQPTTKSNDKAK
jgi:hypothetical protein